MNLVIVVIILIVCIGLLVGGKAKSPSKEEELTFQSAGPLFTPAERSFLGVLDQTLDSRYRVFGKVRLSDLVKPGKGLSKGGRNSASNKVNQKHVDFVVCSASDLSVVGVVELDDKSHEREDRAARDTFVDDALRGANIPIARLPAKKGYQIQEVEAKLAEAFKVTMNVTATSPSVAQGIVRPQPIPANEPSPKPAPSSESKATSPTCEKCGADMVRRQAKKGPHAGNFFWACTAYPRCRQVVAITEA